MVLGGGAVICLAGASFFFFFFSGADPAMAMREVLGLYGLGKKKRPGS